MKSKALNTLLIPSVLLLWAAVIWRYVGPDIFNKNEGKAVLTSLPIILEKQNLESYQLLLDYEDPFLQGYKPKVNRLTLNPRPKANSSIGKVQKIRSRPIRPNLTYQGCVDKENSDQKIALVQIRKVKTLYVTSLRLGDSIYGGSITFISPSKLEISLPDTTWIYKREGF